MRPSLFSIVDAYPEHQTGARDRYAEIGRLAEAADEAGLRAFWVAEHHFDPAGANPSPPVLLAALGARTRRLRLGAMVSVLPFHAPVELAEQYALLDRLLGGRLDLGLGSGYLGLELEGFGVDAVTKRERFDAGLATLRTAWAGRPFRASPTATTDVTLNVRPVQEPHPPLWVAVQRPEAIPYVAKMGANLALVPYATLGSVEELTPLIAQYRAARGPGGQVAAALHVHIGHDVASARAAMQRFLDSRRATRSTFYVEKIARDPRHASLEHLEASGLAALGEPATVRDRLRALARTGVDELLAIVDFGGIDPTVAEGTARALGALGEVSG